ncbi:phage tail tape measure protein, TP901 family, core region [Enterococcus faecalis EnGen0422]|uniref:phage tail tape measure protein n=1 Tax=Enterococcus faecalis TaxID=1351 RepID=UPI000449C2A2|nr:phage tail tape measure protein [Enterococcus faecalis]ETU49060.1 phage tail tape measure protein, TP901 family, core region [Enterococcus faecalis EnGen0422]ETU51463.1 phage tail tape measure protein, TP901 family, core region [Enterococcus faecalis EnGen0422]ETU52079.1 phage tail tape measure protein, TP901 family, core region [Enterococcus faecalis EnGen0422]ETU52583.1 phage tail tape measure protein, TP901 family, core region [Enterococcus faecalis EnGen0422]
MTQSKTVTAILTARDNNFTSAMNGAVSSLKKLNSNASDIPSNLNTVNGAMKSFGDKTASIGQSIEKVGGSMTKGITLPIAGAVGAVTTAAVKWESSFTGVKKTNDEMVDSNGKVIYSYDDLEKGLRDLAKELPTSHEEIAKVAEAAGQLGIKTDKVVGFTKTMIDMGESTNMSADTAATSLARFANITQMSQDKFSNLGSAIVDLGNNLATTESEITEMGLRLAGAGKQIGMTEGDIVGFAAALSSVGIEAEAGGSAFSRLMVQMQLATETGVEAFAPLKQAVAEQGVSWESFVHAVNWGGKELTAVSKQMGIPTSELKKMYKEASKASGSLEDFANVTGRTSEEFAQLFKSNPSQALIEFIQGLKDSEKHGISAIKVLDDMGITEVRLRDSLLRAANASDVFEGAVKRGNEAFNENTALAEEAGKRYGTTESQLKILRGQLNDVAITFGGPLVAALNSAISAAKPMIEALANMAEAFASADPKTQEFILKMAALAASAGPVLKVFGKMTRFFGKTISTMFETAGNIDSKWQQFITKPIVNGSGSALQAVKGFVSKYKSNLAGLESAGVNVNVLTRFTTLGETISGLFPTLDTFRANLRASQRQLNMLGEGNKVTNFFRSFSASLQLSNSKLAKFASVVINPVGSLRNLSSAAGKSGTVLSGLGVAASKAGGGFRTFAVTGIRSIASLTGAMLSNPITAILVAITATIVGVVQAWKSNFMNIQGYVKTAFSGIVKSFKSVLPSSSSVTKTIKGLGNTFKWLGTGAIVGVTFAIAGFVDGLRAIVTVGKTVVNAIMAISNGVKGLWKRLKGDSKGADKAFKDMKKSLSDIEKDWDTMFSDSALKKAAKSTEELGEKSKDTTKAISLNMEEASSSVENYSSKLDEAKQAMTELFSQQNGSTAGVETYFKNTLDLVTNLKEQQKKAVETYNKQIEAAEGKSEAEKQKIFANASSQYMKAVQTNNSDLLKVYTDYSNQLKNNKTVEGQELTEQQRATLQNQTNIIRDQLLQQNQQFVEAGMNKLANKQALSEQEKEQTLTSLRTLGEIQAQQVQENNAQIQQLETQKNQAKTESEKAAFQNQITQLQTQNAQIRQSELEQGAQLLAIISQNGANKIAVTADNLAQLKGVTDQQLLGIYQSYVNNGASIDQQMALLAGMLRQRGIDGSNGLVQGLQSNDPTKWANMSRADIVNTLQALPPDLFRNGQDGKNQLIDGLNSGKTQLNNVGKELMSSMNSGQSSQKSNSKKAAADNSSAAASGTRSKSNEHKNAGKSNAQQTNAGINSEKGNAKNSGSQLGAATIQGYLTQLPPANNAGRSLGNAVSQGAGSVDMSPVGSNMARGVASGIRASQGEAVAAMQNLVAAVNAEAQKKAKIKSPSRLLKYDVGVFLAQGVAAGIREDTSVAVQSAKDMISSIHQSITGSRLMKRSNAIEVKHSIDNTPMGKMVEILEEIRHLTVVMDTGQVVGALGSPMNLNLAEQQKQDGRYRS